MNPYFIKLIAFRNPLFHHSIIPLFQLEYLLAYPNISGSREDQIS
jgi:hypothetical protein